jgi:hypothetical protein
MIHLQEATKERLLWDLIGEQRDDNDSRSRLKSFVTQASPHVWALCCCLRSRSQTSMFSRLFVEVLSPFLFPAGVFAVNTMTAATRCTTDWTKISGHTGVADDRCEQ